MTAKIGGTFLRAALGPIQYAASLVSSNKVRQGIDELAPEPLLAAVNRGVTDLASLVGVPRADIEVSLPMAEFEAVASRLAGTQPRAIAAWNLHAGPTGFLDIITALTVDGRKPEIGKCLERVAKKVTADKALAEPLRLLAVDVDAWEELVARSVDILEQGTWLSKALMRRRLRVLLPSVIAALAIIVCGVLALRLKASRNRVDHALAGTDPCALGEVSEADLGHASQAQKTLMDSKKQACATQKAAEQRAKEEAEAARAAAAKAAAEKQAHLDACAGLASGVKAGTYAETDGNALATGEQASLLARIAKRSLAAADVGPTDPTFPCGDTGVRPDFESAFGAALLADPSLWTQHGDPSALTKQCLVAQKAAIDPKSVTSLMTTAESLAKNALASGKPDTIARAKRLCGLAKELSSSSFRFCEAMSNL